MMHRIAQTTLRAPLWALLWELMVRGRTALMFSFCAAVALPAMIYALLGPYGVDPRSPAMLMLQVSYLQLTFILTAFGVWQAQGPIDRLFALPISTTKIVAWHLISGCVLSAVLVASIALLLNVAFGVQWAVQGPALFAAAAWGIACWLFASAKHSACTLLLGLGAALGMLTWLQTRYGPVGSPQHPWSAVTLGEIAMAAMVIAAAYGVTLLEVSRNRSGEVLLTLGLRKRLTKLINGTGRRSDVGRVRFRTAAQAQLWYEWRQGGTRWVPAIVLGVWGVVVISAAADYFVASFRQTQPLSTKDWHAAALGLSYPPLLLLAMFGLVKGMATSGRSLKQQQTFGESLAGKSRNPMAPFLATRPLSDTAIAWSILQAIALTFVAAWALWSMGYGLFLSMAAVRGTLDTAWFTRPGLSWLGLLLALVPWAVSANLAAGGMAGRPRWIGPGVIMIIACTALTLVLPPGLFPALVTLASFGGVAITLLLFYLARRSRLIGYQAIAASATSATVLAAALIALCPLPPSVMIYVTIVALAALVVLPVAAAPLAVNRNRHY